MKATLLLFARSDSVQARLRPSARVSHLRRQSRLPRRQSNTIDARTHGGDAEQSGRRQPAGADTERPLLLAVDDDIEALRRLTRELRQRYDADYVVVCHRSPRRALETLEGARARGQDVALVLADQEMQELPGVESLTRVRRLHPAAKRGLLVHWGIGRAQSERAG